MQWHSDAGDFSDAGDYSATGDLNILPSMENGLEWSWWGNTEWKYRFKTAVTDIYKRESSGSMFLLNTHRIVSKIHCVAGHKTYLNKFRTLKLHKAFFPNLWYQKRNQMARQLWKFPK